jgi:hypothetical protein
MFFWVLHCPLLDWSYGWDSSCLSESIWFMFFWVLHCPLLDWSYGWDLFPTATWCVVLIREVSIHDLGWKQTSSLRASRYPWLRIRMWLSISHCDVNYTGSLLYKVNHARNAKLIVLCRKDLDKNLWCYRIEICTNDCISYQNVLFI